MEIDEKCFRCGVNIHDTNQRPENCTCPIHERAAQFAVWVLTNEDYINTLRILKECDELENENVSS